MRLKESNIILNEVIHTGNILIDISSPLEFAIYSSLLNQYLPVPTDSVCDKKYNVLVSKGNPYFYNNKSFVEYKSDNILKEDVFALVSRHAEYLFQLTGCYSVHSGGISFGDGGMIFPGRAGAGKTTLTMELAKRGYGVISADRVLMEGNNAISGSHFINVQQERTTVTEENEFDNKIKYEVKSVNVKFIVYPFLKESSLKWKKLAYPENITRFANQMFHFLDEFPRLLVGNEVPFMTPITMQERAYVFDLAKKFVKQAECYAISGRKEEVADWIQKNTLK